MYRTDAPQAKYTYLLEIEAVKNADDMTALSKVHRLNKIRWQCMAENGFYSTVFKEVDECISDAIKSLPAGTEDARRANLYGIL